MIGEQRTPGPWEIAPIGLDFIVRRQWPASGGFFGQPARIEVMSRADGEVRKFKSEHAARKASEGAA